MSAQIKEALAACVLIRRHLFGSITEPAPYRALESVCRALEAAQQEAEAWEVIEKWCREDKFITVERVSGDRSTRLEALTKAAAWCRAELAK